METRGKSSTITTPGKNESQENEIVLEIDENDRKNALIDEVGGDENVAENPTYNVCIFCCKLF